MPIRIFTCPICGVPLEQAERAERRQGLPSRFAKSEAYLTHCQNVHPDFLAWEKSKVKMMVALGVAVAIPVSVVSFWFLLFVVHLPSSAGRGLAFIPIGAALLPSFLFNKLGTRRFRRDWESRGGLQGSSISTPLPSPIQTEYLEEDQGILAVLSDVTRKLDLPSSSLASTVAWQSMAPSPRGRGFQPVPSDGCVIQNGTVYFAENMKGRLSAEDWRPVLASALAYRELQGKMAQGILLRLLPIVAAYVAAWFIVPSFFPTVTYYSPQGQPASYNNEGWLILIFVGFAIMFLSIPIGMVYQRKIKLIADRTAANLVGTSAFLDTLDKLRRASPSNAQSIETRIRNLNA